MATFEPEFITYAQNGEDVLLWRALKHVARGFYIDVGAQDPVEYSVTKAFYDRGWHGVNIEPVETWHRRLVAARPHDLNLCVAVTNKVGTLRLFEIENTGLSTADPSLAERHRAAGRQIHQIEVPCTTLDLVCVEHVASTVHFLKVDCEGAEREVLEGFGLEKVRPWIVVVEATAPNSTEPTWPQWEYLLTGRGYTFAYFDGLNRYYVAREHQDLATAFTTPVNIFDSARPIASIEAERRLVQQQREIEGLKGAAEHARLMAERAAAVIERKRALAERDQAVAEQERALAERDQAVAEQERALAERDQAAAAHARAAAEHDRALAECNRIGADRDRLQAKVSAVRRDAEEYRIEISRLRQRELALVGSHSWRLTAPLRAVSTASKRMRQRARRIAHVVVRPIARALRPTLRRMAANRALRRIVVSAVGRESSITRHARLFLFGVGSPDASCVGVESASLTRDAALSLRGVRPHKPGDAGSSGDASAVGGFDLDAAMECVRTGVGNLTADRAPARRDAAVAGSPDELDSVMRRVRDEVEYRRQTVESK